MSTTVEALKYICTNIDTVLGGSVASEDELDFLKVLYRVAQAAIPRAELEGQAVELLKQHHHFCLPPKQAVGIPSDARSGLEWRIEVHALLTQIENLDG